MSVPFSFAQSKRAPCIAEQNMRCHPPTLAATTTYKSEYTTTMKEHTTPTHTMATNPLVLVVMLVVLGLLLVVVVSIVWQW